MSIVIPDTVRLPHVAFIGNAGAGKTTAAELLVKSFRYLPRSFARPLKDIAALIWGDAARTDRDKLQKLGVAVREIDPDAWARLLVGQVSDEWRFVVDDCRFPNEYHMLAERGFVFVRVAADPRDRIQRLLGNGKLQDEAQLTHVSETALDGALAHYTIHNDGTRQDLDDQIVRVLNKEARKS